MTICKVKSSLQMEHRMAAASSRQTSSETCWIPNTDVYAINDGLVVKVEIAGIRREDLELTAEGNYLKISGFRPDGCRSGKCRFLVMEINYGAFESVIEIPAGYDLGRARAIYQNGFLRIDVPKRTVAETKAHIVPISSEES
jgi:HSP20 family protein